MNTTFSAQDRIHGRYASSTQQLLDMAGQNYLWASDVGGTPVPNPWMERLAMGSEVHFYQSNVWGPVASLMASDPEPLTRWSH